MMPDGHLTKIGVMRTFTILAALAAAAMTLTGCEYVDHSGEKTDPHPVKVPLVSVAQVLSEVPFGIEQMKEVHDAVSSSSSNGYDEEYLLSDMFVSPGTGVGDGKIGTRSGTKTYDRPMRDLVTEYVMSMQPTRADGMTPEQYLEALQSSDMQVYWPYFDNWDGKSYPIITYDPLDGAEVNEGWRLVVGTDGSRKVENILVTEELARTEPVWVVNRNDDSGYDSFEVLRHKGSDPDYGGEIIIKPTADRFKTLIIREFKMLRNYDCWFAGGSEFFVKIGAIEDFSASTEAELRTYSPLVTDFMVVVKRSQVGKTLPLNAVLVSKWTDYLEDIAFMITEDDGGTQTSWKCSAMVKYNSKSYGFDVTLPLNTRDDIVWRGQISRDFFEKYDCKPNRFGDVEVTFGFM